MAKFPNIKLSTIYMGGGTPSLIDSDNIKDIVGYVRDKVCCTDDIEISMEINPGTVNSSKLRALKDVINRISFGVQSFTDSSLKQLNRIHNSQMALSTVKTAQDLGFNNINLDLMHDLPNQTVKDAIFDLQTAVNLNVPHLSWYQLTMEEGTEFYRKSNLNIPDETVLDEIDRNGFSLLENSGFTHYEISGFAKEGFRCRHNLSYWNYNDYIGIGAGAHGKITDWENCRILRSAQMEYPTEFMSETDYLTSLMPVGADSLPFEFFLNKSRLLTEKISINEYESLTFQSIETIQGKLDKAAELGLITTVGDFISVTDLGKKYLNSFLEMFL